MAKHRPCTPRMLQVLTWLAAGFPASYGCTCQSDYGGREGTLRALALRGLITWEHEVTEAGRQLLEEKAKQKGASWPS